METPPPQPADDDRELEIDPAQARADHESGEDERLKELRRIEEASKGDAAKELERIYEGAEGEGSPQGGAPNGSSGYQGPPDQT